MRLVSVLHEFLDGWLDGHSSSDRTVVLCTTDFALGRMLEDDDLVLKLESPSRATLQYRQTAFRSLDRSVSSPSPVTSTARLRRARSVVSGQAAHTHDGTHDDTLPS